MGQATFPVTDDAFESKVLQAPEPTLVDFWADWLGVQAWFVIGGLLCIILGMAMLFTPVVMDLEVHGHAKGSAMPAGMTEIAE